MAPRLFDRVVLATNVVVTGNSDRTDFPSTCCVGRDLIHEKNPDAQVTTHPIDLTYDNRDILKQLIAQADVVICGTDNRPSKLLVNKLWVLR